jgi:hypothetical protein
LFVFKRLSQFWGEFCAVEVDGPYSHPAALDADVAGLDVAFADPGLRSALRAFGAEVVGLEFHVKVYHKCGVVVETKIFSENNS